MLAEGGVWEALSESVSHVLCACHLPKLKDPVTNHVTQPVPPRVDVPAPIRVDWVLLHHHASCVILPNRLGGGLHEIQVSKQVTQVHHLDTALTGSHKLSLS
eukprot:3933025-Rhodomonas_salina.1